jgi:hypothetical protein
MFCHKCGSESIEGSAFCQKCGEKLIADEAAPQASVAQSVSKKKKSKKLILGIAGCAIILVIIIAVASSGGNDRYVRMVKGGTLNAYPQRTIGDAFDNFMRNAKWKSLKAEDGNIYVNVSGTILYLEKEVEAVVQFFVDAEDGSFEYNACEFNGIPQNNLIFWAMLEKIYETDVADGGSSSGNVRSGGNTVRAAPASDFTYSLLTLNGVQGVQIDRYTGNGGALVIPSEIEGYPVLALGNEAFYGENNRSYGPGYNITSVVIPASVKHIGGGCFYWIENLKSVTIQGTGVVVGPTAFGKNLNLETFNIPDGDKVLIPYSRESESYPTSLIVGAFLGCKKLPLAMRARLKAMGFGEP